MQAYQDLLQQVLDEGEEHADRTGIGTLSLFGARFFHDMKNGYYFPLLTTKQVYWKTALRELLWFLSGSNDIRDLWKNQVKIWDGNYYSESWQNNPFYEQYKVGVNYGILWRNFHGVDQLVELEKNIRKDPFSRRHMVTLWDPASLHKTALPPCPMLFHFKVNKNYEMDMIMTQRSCDAFLGVPFNIAECGFLMLMLAGTCGLYARNLIIEFHDFHIYNNHIDAVKEQLSRTPFVVPQVIVDQDQARSLTEWRIDHFQVKDYVYHKKIEAPMAV